MPCSRTRSSSATARPSWPCSNAKLSSSTPRRARYGVPARSHAGPMETWMRGMTYVAAEPRVLQARDAALVLTPEGIAVARRHDDRVWRYAIALLSLDRTTTKEER
jgi:hypothetical protein